MIDLAKVMVKAGNGGNGCISFRREKFVPRGGPDGGDGGNGGNVIFVPTSQKSTLLDFQYQTIFKAKKGRNGSGSKKTGVSGEDIYVEIPKGTILRKTEKIETLKLRELNHEELNKYPIVYDFDRDGLEFIVAKGGKGGKGNWHFRSAQNKAPMFAEEGEEGEEKNLILELKLIADVGLIGFPNAGKSTLISRLTLAKPEIASYPFTTIKPNLGVCEYNKRDFVIADIPGLIEGASQGKGLGFEFLRHIERTKVLVHILGLDEEKLKPNDFWVAYEHIQRELANYGYDLDKKRQIVVMNKMDLPYIKELYKDVRSIFHRHNIDLLEISNVTGKGLEILKQKIAESLNEEEKEKPVQIKPEVEIPTFRLEDLDNNKRVAKNIIRR